MTHTKYMNAETEGGIDNLLWLLRNSTDKDLESARVWYPMARVWCDNIAQEFEMDIDIVAGVTAALSPLRTWYTIKGDGNIISNAEDARVLIGWYMAGRNWRDCPIAKGAGYRPLQKAYRILRDHDSGHLTGPKEIAFHENIMYPMGNKQVTIDTHAANAWAGPGNTGTVKFPPSLRKKIVKAYLMLATMLGMTVEAAQALVWLLWKTYLKTVKTVTKMLNKANI